MCPQDATSTRIGWFAARTCRERKHALFITERRREGEGEGERERERGREGGVESRYDLPGKEEATYKI